MGRAGLDRVMQWTLWRMDESVGFPDPSPFPPSATTKSAFVEYPFTECDQVVNNSGLVMFTVFVIAIFFTVLPVRPS